MEVERRGAYSFMVKLTTDEYIRLGKLVKKCNIDYESVLLHIINVGTECRFKNGCGRDI